MLDFFSQLKLKRQGFSSGKKRRKPKELRLTRFLRSSRLIGGALFVGFAGMLASLAHFMGDPAAPFAAMPGKALFVAAVLSGALMARLHLGLPETFRRNSRVVLILSVIVLQLLLMEFSGFLANTFAPGGGFFYLVIPYGFAPGLVCLLLGRAHGAVAAVYSAFCGALLVERAMVFPYLAFALCGGLVAVYMTHLVRRRRRLISSGLYVGLTVLVAGFVFGIVKWPGFQETTASWETLGRQGLAALAVATLTTIIAGGLLPLFESLFRITTDISWVELADLNHPLLKRMTIEAPGTYHHSLVVANLSEAAAEAIGANASLCRVCSYFHDIGKLNKPEYFIENIGDGENPHDDLTPTMSALIVIAHVKDGVDFALKHNLNREIIAVIREHHGTSLIQYFHYRAQKLKEEVERQVRLGNAREEDIPEVNEDGFRYPGPRPQTRESAIISLADAVESASRTLQKPTPQKIEQLIDEIARNRLREGQFDECPLTLKDLARIKASFAATLRSMLHNRISYPKIGLDEDAALATREDAPAPATGSENPPAAAAPGAENAAPAASAAESKKTDSHAAPAKSNRVGSAA